ncbi:hypothetical protein T02_1152 [Trichinella nativa]|uniref:Uncharacterized protein n=1 Tax=Trichinella nativa TaxID=6335 RepID=A0A0V1LPZ5_9BILA|nr:hypothetical protein T02_1152 [Trichinella nativa]
MNKTVKHKGQHRHGSLIYTARFSLSCQYTQSIEWTGGLVERLAEFLFEVVLSVDVALSVDFDPGNVINWRILTFGLQTHLVEQTTSLVDYADRGVGVGALVQLVGVKALLQAADQRQQQTPRSNQLYGTAHRLIQCAFELAMLTVEHIIVVVHLLPAGFAERYKRHVDKLEKSRPEWFQLGSQERSRIRAQAFVKHTKLNSGNFDTVTRVGIWHQLQGDQYCKNQQQAQPHGA